MEHLHDTRGSLVVFVDKDLQNHLETSDVIRSNSIILAEWNMNSLDNLKHIGNYRHRPLDPISSKYQSIINTFDINDDGNFYKDATHSDITIDGGLDNQNVPVVFTSKVEKERSLFSLEDCFGKFRPRSGINKLRYFENNFSHHNNINMVRRPRYYMADRKDSFKYWTSYRIENNIERGIAKNKKNEQFFIDDAAPFAVYKKSIPTNRLVIKMQTNVGDINLGPYSNSFGSFPDPFYGIENQTTPVKWRIQVLKDGGWIDAKSFNDASIRNNGSAIIGPDGYVELVFGLIVPSEYSGIFKKSAEYSSTSFLPAQPENGEAFLVKSQDTNLGVYHIFVDGQYKTFIPVYGWDLYEDYGSITSGTVTDLVKPAKYVSPGTGEILHREIDYISGIRIVVETMNKIDSTFDLIEMSPRLVADISDMAMEYSVSKQASDLGISGMPVGQLLASTGSLLIFDEFGAFNENNQDSIIADHLNKKAQFKFYEGILNVPTANSSLSNYYVPIKTLYSEVVPKVNTTTRLVDISLRDLFFYFESVTAPQIFLQNVSVSYAVSLLLDNIGFSNYSFKRVDGETEMIIPNFFIGPDKSVAEVLQDIAVSTQTAMFFDEYNNFIMMSKGYMLPLESDRESDITMYGNDIVIDKQKNEYVLIDQVSSVQDLPEEKQYGAYIVGLGKNIYTWSDQTSSWTPSGEYSHIKSPSNIIDVSSQENEVFNDGKISYTTRYIQKSYGSIRQASLLDNEKSWIYKPVLLWEVTGDTNTKSINAEVGNQSSYVLSAIPLNTNLSSAIPEVVNHTVVNNTIDFGEGVYWITRYNGYFYSNGEVIKYDAVQYNVPSMLSGNSGNSVDDNNVWISTVEEYQNYFSKLSFNGKIYPTGLVRIYSEPNYETVGGVTRLKNGAVAKHGRGQFGTAAVAHEAGLSSHWSNPLNRKACTMKSSHLFSDEDIPATTTGAAGVSPAIASKTECNGIIKNFLSNSYISESGLGSLRSTQSGTVQSSALVINGPSFTTTEKPLDSVSYVYKTLDSHYRHFGTRMRIIGKVENSESRGQTPIGSTTYFSTNENSTTSSVNISGASGGLAVMLNPETNNGYYFEIAALTENNIQNYSGTNNIYNIMFYKVKQKSGTTEAIPIRLWAGLTQIVVDDGKFTGQSRIVGEEFTTVYDLSVEYETIGSSRKFYLYVNNNLVAVVNDNDPLPVYNSMALFVRGSARCMFENIYALTNNYGKDSSYVLDTPVNSVFGDDEISVNESFRKYSMSGMVQSTYLSGISSADAPRYNMYFEEFGTIMREASYFNVRYDKAYPALYAQLSPTFNSLKGYTTSGFVAGPYGAEFLIFNATDTALSLDESSGNYLRIQGITFTQQSANELSVDQYFTKNSDLSNPEISGSDLVRSPLVSEQNYKDIKYSRSTYGKNEFALNAPYLQSQDDASSMMEWMTSKIMKPRKAVGISVFAMPTIQLGDIVELDYMSKDGYGEAAKFGSRFVVYSIDYNRSQEGPSMTIYLSEVI
jgi:hypothetical protein